MQQINSMLGTNNRCQEQQNIVIKIGNGCSEREQQQFTKAVAEAIKLK